MPNKLFKYYKYDNHFNMKRLSGEVFLSTPFDFNDPCDCQREVINNSQNREKVKGEGWVYKKLLELGYGEEECNEIANSLLQGDRYKDDVYRRQLERIGILCLTSNKADTLMWGYYASNEGYCIEYDSKKIVHNLVLGYINNLDYITTRHLFMNDNYSQDPVKRTPSLPKTMIDSCNQFITKDIKRISNRYLKEQQNPTTTLNFIKNVYLKRIAGEDIDYYVRPDGSPSNLFFDRSDRASKSKYFKKTCAWKHEKEFRIIASLGGRFVIDMGTDVVKNIYFGVNMKNEKIVELVFLSQKLKLNIGYYKMKRLKNCGLQPVKLDLKKYLTTFTEIETYLNEKSHLNW